ncbi:MAG: M20 metallopeptidase family protein [Myxococcota bacterium]
MHAALVRAQEIAPWLSEVRRSLHRIPELAFAEFETSTFLRKELSSLGLPFRQAKDSTGIIALVRGDHTGPVVALRADMDALPGNELTGLPFRSVHPGVVHACGHDAHMAMVLGAARLLQADPPAGTVVILFQPAEERGQGARCMIEAGALDGVAAIFGGHVTHSYVSGHLMVTSGVVTSQSDRFSVRVTGKAGHAARPHEAIDAVSIAGFLIHGVQTLSRRLNPLHPAVISINQVKAGTAANVIAGEATLEGSVRTSTSDARIHLHEGLQRIAKAAAVLHDAGVEIEIHGGNPPVVNTSRESALAADVVREVFGHSSLLTSEPPSLGSEDFSLYLQQVPGCYVRIGARRPDWEYVPLHSPCFTIDEDALPVGAAYFEQVARRALFAFKG